MNHEEPHSLGAMLSAARQQRGLRLEQAAHETRIRVQMLKDIEADDLTHFSHPSYARMFLTDYARYLGIEVSAIRPYLPEWGECGTEGYQYLQETVDSVKGIRRLPQRPRLRMLATAATLLILLSFGGFKVWKTMRDIERLNLSRVAEEDKSALTVLETVPETVVAVAVVRTGGFDAPDSDISDTLDMLAEMGPVLTEVPVSEMSGPDLTSFVPNAATKPALPDFASEDKAVLFVGGSGNRIQ